jgi:2-amino-4-hydroxy-6-hydroxymethyldihydropteridine diphosphokinase
MANRFPSETKSWKEAYVALGSNLGDREEMLRQALGFMHGHSDIRVVRVSGIYETDPVGYTDQPPFLNMAAAVKSDLAPVQLLRQLLAIEHKLGRVRDIRWGPRTIDLDLLHMEDTVIDTEELTLPHPRMMERAFVLVPLRDIAGPAFPERETVESAAANALAEGKEGIVLWNTINWRNESAPFES